MTHRHSYGTKPQTCKQARGALTNLLYFSTEERLASFTAASLAGSYRVPLPEVELMLKLARERRG